jgi:hypothetical protein
MLTLKVMATTMATLTPTIRMEGPVTQMLLTRQNTTTAMGTTTQAQPAAPYWV